MLKKTKDKKNNLDFIIIFLKNEFTHIKKEWFIFLMCFLISRHSIIQELFPFSIIVLCAYTYIKGPSLIALILCILGVMTVNFDFVYIVMLIFIYLFFYKFRNDKDKSLTLISIYAAVVLFSSKTSILIVEGFSINKFTLISVESVFVFSSIILSVEIIKFLTIIRKNKIKINKIIKSKDLFYSEAVAEVEAVASSTEAVLLKSNTSSKNTNYDRKVINILSDKAKNKIKEQLSLEEISIKYFETITESRGSVLISITVNSPKTAERVKEDIIFVVRNVCGMKIKCTEKIVISPEYYVLKFKNIKKTKIRTYMAKATKDGSPISGDSYSYAGRADRYYAVLCDGMGSGEMANSESKETVNMLSRFLYTDFTEKQILNTLNTLLMLKFDEERYVTFDLHIIDYGNKELRLYKAGACPSFIISGKNVEKIEGRSLPMGILENFKYNKFKRDIRLGDIIIMITDGIVDSINMDSKKSLENFLDIMKDKDPQIIANSILTYALRGQKEIVDDMTVLVTKIG